MNSPFPRRAARRPATSRRRGPARRGAALVEFAIVAPVFLIFTLGMIEVGRAIMVADVLAHAARHGARSACLGSATTASVTAAVDELLTDAGINGETISVLVNGTSGEVSNAETGDAIEVRVSVPYSAVSWVTTPKHLQGMDLMGRVVMRRE